MYNVMVMCALFYLFWEKNPSKYLFCVLFSHEGGE